MNQPLLLLADEPTGALDVSASREVLDRLRQASTRLEQTVVMVTHDPVAAAHADRVLLLSDGALRGTVEQPTAPAVLDAMARMEG